MWASTSMATPKRKSPPAPPRSPNRSAPILPCGAQSAERGRGTTRVSAASESGGGGLPSFHIQREPHNRVCYFFYFILQIGRWNMNYSNAVLLQPDIASFVPFRSISKLMTCPIDFDRQPCRRTIEIEHVRSNRMLTAKHRFAWRALAQSAPQSRLRRR